MSEAVEYQRENRKRIINLENALGDLRVSIAEQNTAVNGKLDTLTEKMIEHTDFAKAQHKATNIGMQELRDIVAARKAQEALERLEMESKIKEDIAHAVTAAKDDFLEVHTESAPVEGAAQPAETEKVSWKDVITFVQTPVGAMLVFAVLVMLGVVKTEHDKQEFIEVLRAQSEQIEDKIEAEKGQDKAATPPSSGSSNGVSTDP